MLRLGQKPCCPFHFFRAPDGRCCFFHPDSGVYGTCSEPFFALGVRQEISGLPVKSLIASLRLQFPPAVLANCAQELERLQAHLHQQSTPPPPVAPMPPRAFTLQLEGADNSLMSEEVAHRALCFMADCARHAGFSSVSITYQFASAQVLPRLRARLDEADALAQESNLKVYQRLHAPAHAITDEGVRLCWERKMALAVTIDEATLREAEAVHAILASLCEQFRLIPHLLSAEVMLSPPGLAPREVAERLVRLGFQRIIVKLPWTRRETPLPEDEEILEQLEAGCEDYARWFAEGLQPEAEHTFPCLSPQDFLGSLTLRVMHREKLTPQHLPALSPVIVSPDGSLYLEDTPLGALPGGRMENGLRCFHFPFSILPSPCSICWVRFLCGERYRGDTGRCDLMKFLAELAVWAAATFHQKAEESRQAWQLRMVAESRFPIHHRKSETTVLWFSRGRGAGHATKDMAIAEQLGNMRPDVRVQFVSYDRGADTFRRSNVPVIDLELPENNSPMETQQRAAMLIERYQPQVVVCHEEFAVPPVARSLGLPCFFITHWFLEADHPWMQMLNTADEIIFIEEPGIFPTPPALQSKTTFVGPLVRPFAYTRHDQERARSELGIVEGTFLVLGLPGRAWAERRLPLFDTALEAFDHLPAPLKLLIWIADTDAPELSVRVKGRLDVRILEFERAIDRLMVASDVTLTKATYTTMRELDTLGVPSVAILHGLNPIDDVYARRIPTVLPLPLSHLTPAALTDALQQAAQQMPAPSDERVRGNGLSGAARCIARSLPCQRRRLIHASRAPAAPRRS